jgi:hypothetical protein
MAYLPRIVKIFERCIDEWTLAGTINGRLSINAAIFEVSGQGSHAVDAQ